MFTYIFSYFMLNPPRHHGVSAPPAGAPADVPAHPAPVPCIASGPASTFSIAASCVDDAPTGAADGAATPPPQSGP